MNKRRSCILIQIFEEFETTQHGLAIALSIRRDGEGRFIVPGCEGIDYALTGDDFCPCISFKRSGKYCQHTDAVRIAKLILERLNQ